MTDPLSDILALLNARCLLSTGLVTGGHWALRFGPFSGLKFNAAVRGDGWLQVEGVEAPIRLQAGDCFILTKGSPFVLASDLALPAVDARDVFWQAVDHVAHYGDEDSLFIVGGRMLLDSADASLLIDALPPVIHVGAGSPQAASMQWLLERLRGEMGTGLPGGSALASHLVQMMFIEGIRAFLTSEGVPAGGWVGAFRDPRLARAVNAMHGEPARRWTLGELAGIAAMSRSSFALGFKATLGVAPLDYLLRWRVELAKRALRGGTESVSAVAALVGYESASAFSNAFRRVTGLAPLAYRQRALETQAETGRRPLATAA